MNNIKDSYTEVLENLAKSQNLHDKLKIEDIFVAGLQSIIWPENENNEANEPIDKYTSNHETALFVRGNGRNNANGEQLQEFYKTIGVNVKIDPTNNQGPTKILEQSTGLKKQINIVNYQVAHIFESRTANPFLFTAPWMVCYIPKIIDPFTGHECLEYDHLRNEFAKKAFVKMSDKIGIYNDFIRDFYNKNQVNIKTAFMNLNKDDVIVALSPIYIDVECSPFKKAIYIELYNKSWWNNEEKDNKEIIRKYTIFDRYLLNFSKQKVEDRKQKYNEIINENELNEDQKKIILEALKLKYNKNKLVSA